MNEIVALLVTSGVLGLVTITVRLLERFNIIEGWEKNVMVEY